MFNTIPGIEFAKKFEPKIQNYQPKFIRAYSKQTNSSLSSVDAFLTGLTSGEEIFNANEDPQIRQNQANGQNLGTTLGKSGTQATQTKSQSLNSEFKR